MARFGISASPWTRLIAAAARYLWSRLSRFVRWIRNYRQVKEHLEQISDINRELLRRQKGKNKPKKKLGSKPAQLIRKEELHLSYLAALSMKKRAHSLPSFSSWLNKGFDLRSHAQQMSDARTDPEISPASIFLTLFHGFVFRLPSFQQLESDFAHSYLQHWVGAERPFRDDTLRYSLCGFDLDPLEAMLVDVNRRLKRGKAFDEGDIEGRRVAAVDGIEVLSSFSRHCENCLQRRVIRKDQTGRRVEETQYYHRGVGCQIVHSPVKPFLALEWLRPGEGEETAALRLLTRLPALYGQYLLRYLASGCAVRAKPDFETDPEDGLGCGHQPEIKLTRLVPIGGPPVCATAAR